MTPSPAPPPFGAAPAPAGTASGQPGAASGKAGSARSELATMPKVELHVHLEGSIRPETAIHLARRHGEDPAAALVLEGERYPRRFDDFMHFVRTFLATSAQVRTPEDLCTVAADFAQAQAEQGVRYAEVTVTAVTLVDGGIEPTALWQALREGLARAPAVTVGLIVDAVRDAGVGHAQRTVELVAAADAPIVGLGLSGVEGSLPEASFAVLRDAADRLGLGLTVHAGETGTPDNVRAALDDLGADRIGHGIAAVHDRALMERLVREQVPLEVCPSSNVTLQIVRDLAAHPLPRLLEAGANVTISSDDPPFFTTTLTDELAHAADLCGLSRAALVALQRRAARAAFLPGARSAELVGTIDGWEAGSPPQADPSDAGRSRP